VKKAEGEELMVNVRRPREKVRGGGPTQNSAVKIIWSCRELKERQGMSERES